MNSDHEGNTSNSTTKELYMQHNLTILNVTTTTTTTITTTTTTITTTTTTTTTTTNNNI